MFAVADAIAERLSTLPELTGWQIRREDDDNPRDVSPAVHIRMEGAGVAGGNDVMVQLAPQWGVYLIVAKGQGDTVQLDAAFNAAIEALISFAPGERAGRPWTPMRVVSIPTPEPTDSGLFAYGIIFETSAFYSGKN